MEFIKKHPEAQLPTRSSKHSVGYDFYIFEDTEFYPNQFKLVDTYVAVDLPEDMHLQLHARSSLYKKRGFIFPNSPGIIDPDYTDSIKIPLVNLTDLPVTLKKGERVAQGIFIHHQTFDEVEGERVGGFGSSGK